MPHKTKGQPVWQDPDDAEQEVDVSVVPRLRKLRKSEAEETLGGDVYGGRLREQYEKLQRGSTAWAELPSRKRRRHSDSSDEEEEEEEEAVRRQSAFRAVRGLGRGLPPERISVTRVKDANLTEPSAAVIQSVQFHPSAPMLLTAGLDKTMRLFHVDGSRNPKIRSVHFTDLPIYTAAFTADGAQVICSGRRRYFYVVDLQHGAVDKVPSLFGREERSLERFVVSPDNATLAFFGNDGYIVLVSAKTKHVVGTMKMNGSLRCGAFSSDGGSLYTAGGDGQVCVWDMRKRECMLVHDDEGSAGSTSIAVSPAGGRYAVGAGSGVVNVYSEASGPRVPAKALMNLVTTVDTMQFNHTGEILAIGSRMKRNALKLVHIPSMTVFSNWPTSHTPLRYVHSLAFSPQSGFMAVGNDRGRVLLYRVNHYESM